jgi:hypothetical protein
VFCPTICSKYHPETDAKMPTQVKGRGKELPVLTEKMQDDRGKSTPTMMLEIDDRNANHHDGDRGTRIVVLES